LQCMMDVLTAPGVPFSLTPLVANQREKLWAMFPE